MGTLLDYSRSQPRKVGGQANSAFITSVTSGDSYGSWVEMIASTAGDGDLLLFQHFVNDGIYQVTESDIGVGASGSEVVVCEGLTISRGTDTPNSGYIIPIDIPSGSRVSMRSRTAAGTTTSTTYAGINIMNSGRSEHAIKGSKVIRLGRVETDPGATAYTKGAWAELTGSTPESIKGYWAYIDSGDEGLSAASHQWVDIAVGAASSERRILGDFYNRGEQTSLFSCCVPGFIPISIAKGERISARSASSNTATPDRLMFVTVWGLV